jgi:hypothetical protein
MVAQLITEVLQGVAWEYSGGRALGLVISPAGKLAVRVLRNGKEVVEELSEEAAKRFRRSINEGASHGGEAASDAKKWLDNAKAGAKLDFAQPSKPRPRRRQ